MSAEKRLTDFPEYVRIHDAVEKLKAEKAEVASRLEQISLELSQPRQRVGGQSAWQATLQNQDSCKVEIDVRSSLKEELLMLEGRQKFIDDALIEGEVELDRARGAASLEICNSIRPQYVAIVRRVLESLKALCEANAALQSFRADLDAAGIVTGSLPHAGFDVGTWNDPHGGRLVGYQRHVAEHFPELASLAGESIKGKLKALSERERAFEEERSSQ